MSRTTSPASHPELTQLREQLAGVCTRDYGRLLGRWRKLSRTRGPAAADVERLRRDMAASVAMREARVAGKPLLRLGAALPISARAEDIIGLIRDHPVVVVAGETGSGKTTQLPKLCLAAGRGEAGLIGCTQPRRLAARAVARRVAEEMDTSVGDKVGFQVRFTEKVSDKSLVKFMTDGILLAETQSDPWLSAYDTLIIDEAHERSLNIDFLLGYLKGLVKRRRDLKIIITSATIDTARFAAHFDDAPVVEVEGRTFPVDVRWRPIEDAAEERVQQGSPEHIVRAVDEIGAEDPRGDILVFLPGEREIRDAHKVLSRRQYRHTEILPLYARLSVKDQDRVFKPGPQRRIVLATNVAETSLTVPRIRCVIDIGTARVMRYSRRSQIERLHVEPVSQAAANQRKGRCGRIGPGVCIRLYGEQDYDGRPRFTEPELLRSSLANVILRMLNLKLGDVDAFPFLDAPDPSAIADGYRRLAEVSAIDDDKRLTPMGRDLVRLPIDVQLARMLIEARQQDVLADVLVVVAFLSVQDPRQRPPEARQQADAAHRQFIDPKSDFVTVLNLWRAFAEVRDELTQSKLRDWCTKHFLGYLRMREWREVHRQLKLVMKPGLGARDVEKAGLGTRDSGLGKASLRSVRAEKQQATPSRTANAPEKATRQSGGNKKPSRGSTSDAATPSPESRVPSPVKASLRAVRAEKQQATPSRAAKAPEKATRQSGGNKKPSRGSTSDAATPSPESRVPSPVKASLRSVRAEKQQATPSRAANAPEKATRQSGGNKKSSRGSTSDAATPSPESRVPSPVYEALHCSLLAGLPTQGARKDEHGIYRGTRQRKFEVFPGSGLAKSPPNWVFAAQILDISGKVWGMQCARIEPRWIERQAAHLIRHTCRDAHWSRKRGSVVAWEQVSLFGLILVERRPVTFRRQDPALAHAVFVREALARCDIDCKAAAMRANQRVLAKAGDIEARQRRQGLLKTDEELAHFFTGKLPEDISDSRALDAWYRKASPAEQQALQWSLDDVMASDNGLDAGAFPSALELDGQRYRLTYRFVPGDAADGVTLHLPLSLLNALPAARCQWLVPGLVAEKVAEMIRGLPKSLRRNFVPAPDFARAFTEAESSCDKPLAQVLAKFLTRATGIVLPADAFDDTVFSAHLRMRFALVDDNGKLLGASRDLAELQAQWEGQARAAFSRKADVDLDTSESQQWDFADIPARIQTAGKPDAYPALVDQGTSVALRLFERNLDARSEHARGVERLLRFALESAFKRARKQLPISKTLALQYVPLGTQASLREDLVEGGFADLLRERDMQVRSANAYAALHDDIARSLFGAAMERLQLAEPIIATQAEAQRWMQPPRPGQSPASYNDLTEQLDHLIAPGFLRDLPGTRLAHYPRYLKAMRLRAERLQRDPGKDYRHLQQVLPYWRACLAHCFGERTDASEHLRWLLEEWRVSLFAQELKTAEPVSEKRMRNALDAVENPS